MGGGGILNIHNGKRNAKIEGYQMNKRELNIRDVTLIVFAPTKKGGIPHAGATMAAAATCDTCRKLYISRSAKTIRRNKTTKATASIATDATTSRYSLTRAE